MNMDVNIFNWQLDLISKLVIMCKIFNFIYGHIKLFKGK